MIKRRYALLNAQKASCYVTDKDPMDSCPQGSVIATHVARHSNAVLRRAQDINVNNGDRLKLFQIHFYNNIV